MRNPVTEYREQQSVNKMAKRNATQAAWGARLETWPRRVITVGVLGLIGMAGIRGCAIANENGATEGLAVAGGEGVGEAIGGSGDIFSGTKTLVVDGSRSAGIDLRSPIGIDTDGGSNTNSSAEFGDNGGVVVGGSEAPTAQPNVTVAPNSPETPAPAADGFVYHAVQPSYEVNAGEGAYAVVNACGGLAAGQVANGIKDELFQKITAVSPALQDGLQPGDIANCLIQQ